MIGKSLVLGVCFVSGVYAVATPGFFPQYEEQAVAIVSSMTLAEKIGHMVLPTFDFLTQSLGSDQMALAQAAWQQSPPLPASELGPILGFDQISSLHLGAVLQAGGPISYSGQEQGLAQWQRLADTAAYYYNGPAGTQLLQGTDAIHGNQHVVGSIIFPHNIGLGATHNPNLVQSIANYTALNIINSHFNWSFMPTVARGQDYRWGRFYECFSSDNDVLKALSYSYVLGLQAIDNTGTYLEGVLGTAKHFLGDGATQNGVDEGYAYARNSRTDWLNNGIGYEGAVLDGANVGSIMASYNSTNGVPMHFGGPFDLINQFCRTGIVGSDGQIYKMDGFVVSDYVGVSRAIYKNNVLNNQNMSYVEGLARSVNAGVDLFMIALAAYENPFIYETQPPYATLSPLYYTTVQQFVDYLTTAVTSGLIPMSRIDEAVTRIIRTKLSMQNTLPGQDSSDEEFAVAKQAAEQSLVLLKNNSVIPVSSGSIQNVFLMGKYDDIGAQCGGWTINWQGQGGNGYWAKGSINKTTSYASSILDGVVSILGDTPTYFLGENSIVTGDLSDVNVSNSIAIIVIGEYPYAEYNGDVDNLNPWYLKGAITGENLYITPDQAKFLGVEFTSQQTSAIARLQSFGVNVITVLISGRPLVITEGEGAPLPLSNALIAAWLPGTAGGIAIANAIFGQDSTNFNQSYQINGKTYYSNTLPFAWPSSMREVLKQKPTLFPLGYGLNF
jgi:beta-glucosidase